MSPGTIAAMDGTGTPETSTVEVDSPDEWDGVPPSLQPRKKLPKWPFIFAGVVGLVFTAILMVTVITPINVPYYAFSPGPASDTSDFITVPDAADSEGELFFLTVSLQEVNVLEYVAALIDDEVDLAPQENVRPAGVTPEQLRQQNLNLMVRSQDNARFVALTRAGYEVTYEGSGAAISSIVEDTAAEELLLPGDVIVAVDGEPVEFSTDAANLIGGRAPGDSITLLIQRPVDGTEGEFEELEVVAVLGPYSVVDEDGDLIEDPDRGLLGVFLEDAETVVVFPIDIEIDSQNIGGPSAGMMFTLEIINQLTEDDLTKGYRIAGTGTIDQDGNIGSIGGIRQKIFGAIDMGATHVLVPAGNYDEAVEVAGDDIIVIRVVTIDDALAFFETL
jgi:PDZ domain-containing protein